MQGTTDSGVQRCRRTIERGAAHRRRYPRPHWARVCLAAGIHPHTHRLRLGRGLGEGRACIPRRASRSGDRPADQSGASPAHRTRVAQTPQTACDHGRLVRLPRQHHSSGGMERRRGSRCHGGGVRRVGSRGCTRTSDRVRPESHRNDRHDPGTSGQAGRCHRCHHHPPCRYSTLRRADRERATRCCVSSSMPRISTSNST